MSARGEQVTLGDRPHEPGTSSSGRAVTEPPRLPFRRAALLCGAGQRETARHHGSWTRRTDPGPDRS